MFAPPTRTRLVTIAGTPDAALVAEAQARLASEPGLGAVILSGSAAVLHEPLLAFAPLPEGDPDAAWLGRLNDGLVRRGYLVDRVGASAPTPAGTSKAAGKLQRIVRRKPRSLALQARQRWRRRQFLKLIRREAWLVGAKVELDVAKDLIVQQGVRIQVYADGGSLRIGPRCSIASGVVLRIGGELDMGRNIEIRYDAVLNVKGRLVLEGRNVISRGNMLHADGSMLFEWGASTAEYVSVLDSHHDLDGSLIHVHDHGVQILDTTIGAATLLGAGVLVMPGVRIGRGCLVGAHSVVTKDVPDGWIAIGSPAKHLRPVAQHSEPA